MIKRTTLPLLALAGLLALPATGLAAETVGSDLTRVDHPDARTDTCGGCTLIADRVPWQLELGDDTVITKVSAYLGDGAQVRLRVLRRNGDGTFTAVGRSATFTAQGDGVHSFPTHLAVPAGDHTIGLDVLGESRFAGLPDESFDTAIADLLDDGATTPAGVDRVPAEVFFNAAIETDYDKDGKGDETEDDCLWECPGGGSGGNNTNNNNTNGGGAATTGGGGSLTGPGPAKEPETPKTAPVTIDPRGLLRPASEGRQGWFEVFVENTGSGEMDGTLTVKAGRTVVGTQKVEDVDSGDDVVVKFRLSAAQRKQLARKRKLALSLTGSVTHTAAATPVSQPLTVVPGGASKFDGEYRGPGPIVFVVRGGAIRTVASQVNAFCPSTNRHEQLSIFSIDGFPALVGPDGSFDADGRAAGQKLTYKGKLSLTGKSKGYASAYAFRLATSDSGKLFTDGCTGAINWTAKKTK